MKHSAVPSIGMPLALTFEKIRKLWPRYPELVAEVTSLTGWRDVWVALVAGADRLPARSMPRLVEDEMAQPQTLKECAVRMRRGEQKLNSRSVSDLREAEVSFQHIIWLLSTLAPADRDMKRRLRLWSADCVARVLPLFEITYPYDTLVRDTIHSARRFARSEISEMKHEKAAVLAASLLARRLSTALVMSAASYLVREEDSWADNVAAKYSRSAAVHSCNHVDPTEIEMQWQFARLIARMSAHEPNDWPFSQVTDECRFASTRGNSKEIIGNVSGRLDYIADREDNLLKLHELLTCSDFSKQRHLVVVRGSVGKSELAIEYAHRFVDSYSGIW
jgi:hypothetical protein